MSSEVLHEARNDLSAGTVDRHRAIASLMEELEAVDWYDQRVEAATDPDLAAILRHNRDEEKEHASMVLEWLRRKDPVLDGHLRRYLFTEESITAEEHEAEDPGTGSDAGAGTGADGPQRAGSLGIGALRDKERL